MRISILSLGLGTLLLAACSEFSAQHTESSEKLQFLSNVRIFGMTKEEAIQSISTKLASELPTPTPGPTAPPAPPQVGGAIPIKFSCLLDSLILDTGSGSNSNSIKSPKGSVRLAATGTLGQGALAGYIRNASNQVVCKFDPKEVVSFVNTMREIRMPNLLNSCPGLQPGNYMFNLGAWDDTRGLAFQDYNVHNEGIQLKFSSDPRTGKMDISSSSASPNFKLDEYAPYLGVKSAAVVQEGPPPMDPNVPVECDMDLVDPLIIQFNDGYKARTIKLTSQLEGILFDIYGSSVTPAFQKSNISWFADSTTASYNAWLVKPNSSGGVAGIDDMFGDRTRGPDNAFATHGFEALAKWDGRGGVRDSRIDRKDAIYTQLAVWRDKNLDGIAQPEELTSLAASGVESIDLNYDTRFAEHDPFGNQIKYKSVVRMKDGRLNLIFDLWFRAQ